MTTENSSFDTEVKQLKNDCRFFFAERHMPSAVTCQSMRTFARPAIIVRFQLLRHHRHLHFPYRFAQTHFFADALIGSFSSTVFREC